MQTIENMPIRCRLEGRLEGAYGPLTDAKVDRKRIAQTMGWEDGGKAVEVITKTLALLADGKAVRLTSHYGYCVFQPLLDTEDGLTIPASASKVYQIAD